MNIVDFLNNDSVVLIAVFTPIILAVVSLAKQWVANSKWYPIVSVLVGIILAVSFSGLTVSFAVLLGVLAGLSASGLYSGAKAVVA